jgi:hypothetical protein
VSPIGSTVEREKLYNGCDTYRSECGTRLDRQLRTEAMLLVDDDEGQELKLMRSWNNACVPTIMRRRLSAAAPTT